MVNEPKGKLTRGGIITLVACFLVLVGGVTAGFLLPSEPNLDEVAEKQSYAACRAYMRSMLKAPTTAEFASTVESQFDILDNGRSLVQSYVDADNSFGAHIRTYFYCLTEPGASGWEVVEFETAE